MGLRPRRGTGLYKPNEHFDTVSEAWQRRSGGDSLETIVAFLLRKNYYRKTKGKRKSRIILPTKNAVSKIFRDPFYYGLLVQVNQTVDLRTIYDFKPMIDEEMYNLVQAVSRGRTKDVTDKKRALFKPLQGFVYCAVCNSAKHMLAGRNKPGGSKHYVLTYRCDNPDCNRKVKSFRAKYVFNSIYDRLADFELTDKAYELYSARIDSLTDDKLINIKQDIRSRRGALTHIKSELNDRALNAGTITDRKSFIYTTNEKRINDLAIEQADLEGEIEKLEQKIANPQRIKLSKVEFLNLTKTAADKMKAGSAVEKDALCRILFLNLRVDNEKVASYLWREPFASLVKTTESTSGGA